MVLHVVWVWFREGLFRIQIDLDRVPTGSRYGLDSVDIGFRSCLRGVDSV